MTVTAPQADAPRQRWQISLFWRTFFLLVLLLLLSGAVWLQAFFTLEFAPRRLHMTRQIASFVNISRSALNYSDAAARRAIIAEMARNEGMRVRLRERGDRFEPVRPASALTRQLVQELMQRLGDDTLLARSVNGEAGLWVGFTIQEQPLWLQIDRARLRLVSDCTLLIWISSAVLLSLLVAAVLTWLINRPLKRLSETAHSVRHGGFAAARPLDEHVLTAEIRQLNSAFNRMVQTMAQREQERCIMLAGISHDLRTPLARLRLETEMSVSDAQAHRHMCADIEQLGAIIDKFLDYARPGGASAQMLLQAIPLRAAIAACIDALHARPGDVQVDLQIAATVQVLAEPLDLARIITNLLENALHYGKTPASGTAHVHISAESGEKYVTLLLRDHGSGVPPDYLPQLMQPFFRGDAARTAATGAGLGLSIVHKTVQRMGGALWLENAAPHDGGGLQVRVQLQRAGTVSPQGKL